MPKIFIKQEYKLAHLELSHRKELNFYFIQKGYQISLNLSKIIEPNPTLKLGSGDFLCSAILEHEITERQKGKFDPKNGNYDTGQQGFLDDLISDLHSSTMNALQLIYWRTQMMNTANNVMLSYIPMWSIDEKQYYRIERKLTLQITLEAICRDFADEENNFIRELLNSSTSPSLSFDLITEAKAISKNNPRSALVIAVAALETATKNFISHQNNQFEWWVNKIQSPPIVDILKEFLPALNLRKPFENGLIIPDDIIEHVKNLVQSRNNIMHGKGHKSPTADHVNKAIWLVVDLIYLFDYLKGHDWAEKLISIETMQLINKSNHLTPTSPSPPSVYPHSIE